MTLDLAKYGITDVKEVVHNPSYEQLHKDKPQKDWSATKKVLSPNSVQ